MENKNPHNKFDELVDEVISNARKDRESFIEIIDEMKKLTSSSSEVALVMCETLVKAHDVLNKMNSSLISLASTTLKDKNANVEEKDDDIYSEIGNIVELNH